MSNIDDALNFVSDNAAVEEPFLKRYARAELAQLRVDLQAAQSQITQLEKVIALNRYITPPFELTDDATVQLALECAKKDEQIDALHDALTRIREAQAQKLEEQTA